MGPAIGNTIIALFWLFFGVIYGLWFITGIILAVVFLIKDKKKAAKVAAGTEKQCLQTFAPEGGNPTDKEQITDAADGKSEL